MPATSLETIRGFLAQKRIAVAGVSRNPKDFNTTLFRDLLKKGYDAVPVNPNATEIEGVKCFPSVRDVNPPADAVLVMTPSDTAEAITRDCVDAGIKHVWLYRAVGKGAVSESAVETCVKNGVSVVAGGCPYMFLRDTQWFHRVHGFVLKIIGQYPA